MAAPGDEGDEGAADASDKADASNKASASDKASASNKAPPPDLDVRPLWVQMLGSADKGLAKVEEWILVLNLLVLVLVAIFDALKRNFFPPAVFWSSEVIRFSTFFIGLTGAALAAQSNRLISIDMMTRMLKPRGRLIVRMLTTAFTIAVCVLFFLGSLKIYTSTSLDGEIIPARYGTLAMPIAITLIALHMLVRLVSDAEHLAHRRIPQELVQVAPAE